MGVSGKLPINSNHRVTESRFATNSMSFTQRDCRIDSIEQAEKKEKQVIKVEKPTATMTSPIPCEGRVHIRRRRARPGVPLQRPGSPSFSGHSPTSSNGGPLAHSGADNDVPCLPGQS